MNLNAHRRLLCLLTGIICACPTLLDAQVPQLGFPVAGDNPYTVQIITVLDHSTDYFYDSNHHEVLAYTGEKGQAELWLPKGGCGPSGDPCGYYNPQYSSSNPVQFVANGNYVGAPLDSPVQLNILNYRGHSGYDYKYGPNTAIVAAQDGILYVPATDVINNPQGSYDPWCDFHTFYIDHGNGWTTWYLHADHLTVGSPPHACPNGYKTRYINQDEYIAYVHKGQPVAMVGNFAYGHAGGVGYHLHFEVRMHCDHSTGVMTGCLIVDPYGWEWTDKDPIDSIFCANNPQAPCAGIAQTGPLWSLSDWGLQQPFIDSVAIVPSSGGFTATINGRNFASPGALVSLWDRQGQYKALTLTPQPLTPAQIVVQLPNPPVTDPGAYVFKVKNPNGPRSPGFIAGVVSTLSTPLILDGTQAPGGGTFFGFGGFWAFTNRGESVFDAGVDLNGNQYFADFELSAGR